MTPEEILNTTLLGNAPLSAVVGARIYPSALPQEPTLPAIAFNREDTEFVTTIHNDTIHAEIATLNIYAMGKTAAIAEATALLIRGALPAGMLRPSSQAAQYDFETDTFTTMLIATVWSP